MEDNLLSHRRANVTFLVLSVVSVFFLSSHLTGYVRGVKDFIFYVLFPSPASATRAIESSQGFSRKIAEIVRIHQENQALKKALERYAYLDGEFNRTRDENLRLRQIVGFASPGEFSTVAARIVAREPGSWFQWVSIDRGSDGGVRVGAPVIAWSEERPAVLGRVNEVFAHSAKVVLITNVISAIPAQARAVSEDGLIEGQNSHRLRINYLVPDTKVTIGSEIVTSPISTVFPPGMLIGRVLDLLPAERGGFSSALVRPAVNFNNLREVIVLIPGDRAGGN